MLRKERSKAAFARFLGIPAPMYHRYEQGQVPKDSNLGVIADKCGVTVDWLLGRDPSEGPARIYGAAARSALEHQEQEKLAAFDAQDRARLTEFWKVVESVTPLMLRGGPNVETCQQMIRAALDDFAAWCKALEKKPEEPPSGAEIR